MPSARSLVRSHTRTVQAASLVSRMHICSSSKLRGDGSSGIFNVVTTRGAAQLLLTAAQGTTVASLPRTSEARRTRQRRKSHVKRTSIYSHGLATASPPPQKLSLQPLDLRSLWCFNPARPQVRSLLDSTACASALCVSRHLWVMNAHPSARCSSLWARRLRGLN